MIFIYLLFLLITKNNNTHFAVYNFMLVYVEIVHPRTIFSNDTQIPRLFIVQALVKLLEPTPPRSPEFSSLFICPTHSHHPSIPINSFQPLYPNTIPEPS